MMLRRSLFLCCLLPLLTACGPTRPKIVGPPQVTVQELVDAGGDRWQAQLRINNIGNVNVRVAELRWRLQFAGRDVASGTQTMDLQIGPSSGELVPVEFSIASDLPAVGALRNNGVPYKLTGSIVLSDPSDDYDVIYEGRLAPTPGKPNTYR